jgi:hypothetical protein
LFKSAYVDILRNPKMSIIGTTAKKLTTAEKYDLIKKYVEGGGGTLRVMNGRIVYANKKFQDTGRSK